MEVMYQAAVHSFLLGPAVRCISVVLVRGSFISCGECNVNAVHIDLLLGACFR